MQPCIHHQFFLSHSDMEYRLCFCFYTNTNVLIAQSNTLVVTNSNPQQTIPTVIVDSHLTNEPIPIRIQGQYVHTCRTYIIRYILHIYTHTYIHT